MVESYLLGGLEVYIMEIATARLNKKGRCVVCIVKTGQTGTIIKDKLVKNGVVKW